jgi:hypothetical protein
MSAQDKPLIPFTPVALRARHDGWTAEKQIAFIEALAETACVEEACRRVGMSDSSAYQLRRRPRGFAFRQAWDAALDYALNRLEQAALSRALNGVPRPVFYKGEQVGEWREYDERLTIFLLRNRSGSTARSRSMRCRLKTKPFGSTRASKPSNSTRNSSSRPTTKTGRTRPRALRSEVSELPSPTSSPSADRPPGSRRRSGTARGW